MYEAKGKVILVTGGALGIGAGIVRAFVDEGAKHVAALDIDIESGTALEKEVSDKYGPDRIKFHKCDVTSDELESAYANILNELGYIDVVVNCAGIMNDRQDAYLKEIAINVTALITSSMKAYNIMRKDRGGSGGTIINIASIVALFQSDVVPIYGATKSAVLQFSNCLGMKSHYSRSDVRVLTVCFGCTDTTLFSTTKMGAIDEETDIILPDAIKRLPMQKAESAVQGLMEAYKSGASASTWLVTSDRPAEDITNNVTKAYEIMSQGIIN